MALGTTPLTWGWRVWAAGRHRRRAVGCLCDPIQEDQIQLASLMPTGTLHVHPVHLSALSSYEVLTWSPNGQYLAAMQSDFDGCSVAIYGSPPPHTTFTLVVQLTSTDFTGPPGACSLGTWA